jgi:hypothetical protein
MLALPLILSEFSKTKIFYEQSSETTMLYENKPHTHNTVQISSIFQKIHEPVSVL